MIASPEKLEQDLQKELNADPSELKSRAWYHGSISRQRAESLVTNQGDFLVRDSISKPGDFVLTCSWRGVPLHFMVNALVGDCAPGSLPSISYQFEEESFSSIQELIQHYLTRQKPVTLASGAVLRHPVARCMPLSYYDSKYGSLHSLDGAGHYTPSHSPKPSPFTTPNTSPRTSPVMNRRAVGPGPGPGSGPGTGPKPKRTGSQPLLCVDDSEVHRSRSPSLERFGSLPVINIIPPGGPGYVSGFQQQPRVGDSGSSAVTGAPRAVGHQRAGSAPVLMNEASRNGGGGAGGGLFHSQSARRVTAAGSESNLTRAPPPKPSRIPSIKYKKKPLVLVRNKELYEDDGRDYTDMDQLSGPPSWAQDLHQRVGLEPEPQPQPHPQDPYGNLPAHPAHPASVAKSHSFQDENIYDNNFNSLKGYQTLPVKSKSAKQPRPRLLSAGDPKSSSDAVDQGLPPPTFGAKKPGLVDNYNDNYSGSGGGYDLNCPRDRKITMPGFNLGSRINLDSFSSSLFPAEENRLLEPSAVLKAKSLLLNSNARAIAGHLTKVDLDVLRVAQDDDLGVGVTSGIELCTLPQGSQLRENIIER